MHARSSWSAVAVLIVAACLVFVAGCVPRPASVDSSSRAGTGTATASVEPDGSVPVGPVGPTPSPSFVRPTALPAPTFLAYTVKEHDNLTSVARAFHTTPRSIAFWSRGDHPPLDPESATYDPNRLEVGWVLLLIPDEVFDEDELIDATPSATPSPTPAASASAASNPTPGATAG
ncbi:MAG: hypothetical protein ACXW4H_04335 [Candidatus Limnocylindrales bacterium]